MGNKQKQSSSSNQNHLNQEAVKKNEEIFLINKNHFDFLYVIGRGGFGKVWKVNLKKYKTTFAMKEMLKAKVIEKRSERSIRYERELLSKMKHGFIVNMHYAFQDKDMLYLVIDFLSGGDMRFQLAKNKRFTEEQTSKKYNFINK